MASLIWAATSGAQTATDPGDLRVTAKFERTLFRTAINQLFAGRASVIVCPNVDALVTDTFIDTRFETALQAVCKQADATYRIADGVYEIVPRPDWHDMAPPDPGAPVITETSVSVNFTNVDARTAFYVISNAIESSSVVVDPTVRTRITLTKKFDSPLMAMSYVAQMSNATVTVEDGKYMVKLRETPVSLDKVVSLECNQTDVRDALRQLFRNVNINYSIAPEVQGTVTCKLNGPFDQVLWRVLGSLQSYFVVESGVVEIVHEAGAPSPPRPKPSPFLPPTVAVPDRFQKTKTPGGLVFRDALLKDVLNVLFTKVPNRYSLKTLGDEKLSGDLSHIPLDDALRVIASQTAVDVRYIDDAFVFQKPAPRRVVFWSHGPDDFIFRMIKGSANHGWIETNPPSKP